MENTLSRQEVIDVIEGKGAAKRIPLAVHQWMSPQAFLDKEEIVRGIQEKYPNDVQAIFLSMPQVFDAPSDDPSFRWLNFDNPFPPNVALDAVSAISDYDDIDAILSDFPDPNYHGIMPQNPPQADGRYRLGAWWYLLFERFWSLRGMENALCDFYEYPDEVHKLFRALTDFYKSVMTRAKKELNLDGMMVSDDIGTQTSTFFSEEIFTEFFKPYYKELFDHAHSLDMHFWLHTCGNVLNFIPHFIEIGLDVLHPIQKYTMEEKEVAQAYGDKICIWAGFDVQQKIPYGTPEDVREEVRFMYDTYFRKDGRFILALGNNVTPDTPVASVEALLDEAVQYGLKKCAEDK